MNENTTTPTNPAIPTLASITLTMEDNLSSSPVPAPAADMPQSALCTLSSSLVPTVIDTKLPAPTRRRNGRVACLPKVQREMVNHMLWNGVPYKNIVSALDEADYQVTERQISSWATGGYLEWSLAQEHVLQNRLNQDHLLDFLRRDDAPELPEVGLQAAATQLSQVLVQKLARAEDPEAHLDNYSKLVDMLVRLNREIAATQKQRDDSRRTLGREYDPVLVKDEEEIEAIQNERFYSNPPSDSGFTGPAVPPALPHIPTATFMAAQAREERECAAAERRQYNDKLWEACLSKPGPATKRIDDSTSTPSPVGAR